MIARVGCVHTGAPTWRCHLLGMRLHGLSKIAALNQAALPARATSTKQNKTAWRVQSKVAVQFSPDRALPRLQSPITTACRGGSVQQRLSAAVALAAKRARIMWAMLARGAECKVAA